MNAFTATPRSILRPACSAKPRRGRTPTPTLIGAWHQRATRSAATPHDLRRTAATLAGDLGFDAWIAKCLDHAASKKQEQIVPSVTGKVYNHSKRMKEKRAVLDGVAAELQRIIGEPVQHGEVAMRLAA